MFGINCARGLYARLLIGSALLLVAAPAFAGEAVQVTASTLNVRTGPGTNHARIGQVHRGETYAVLGRSGSWVKLQLDQRAGWSHGSYLRASSRAVYRVTAAALNVRTGASTRYRVLGRLPRGARVAVSGSSGAWRKISFGGRAAWVHGHYLARDGGGSSSTPASSGQTYTVTASTLNVRSGPGTNHSVLGQVHRGDHVTVTGSSGSWRQIVWGSGRAWVYGRYVTRGSVATSRAGFIQLPASGSGFVSYQAGYRRWGTPTLIYGLQRAARRYHAERGGARIRIGDISKQSGGYFPPHVSHRVGKDVDVGPMRNDRREVPVTITQSAYSRTLTRRVLDFMRAELPVSLILFNDTRIPGVRWYSGHHNHFHLRIR